MMSFGIFFLYFNSLHFSCICHTLIEAKQPAEFRASQPTTWKKCQVSFSRKCDPRNAIVLVKPVEDTGEERHHHFSSSLAYPAADIRHKGHFILHGGMSYSRERAVHSAGRSRRFSSVRKTPP